MMIEKREFTADTLRRLQQTQLEILNEIVRICDRHGLRYYLAEGTLLGAVRHQGFIPWDDDLDIAMPREDYDRFWQICAEELSPAYYVHTRHTDDTYWLMFGKVRKAGTVLNEYTIRHIAAPKGIYVDVFPLDDAKAERGWLRRLRTTLIHKVYALIAYKRGLDLPLRGAVRAALWLTRPVPIRWLSAVAERWMRAENGKGYAYYVNYGSLYDTVAQTIPKSRYEPAVKLKFEGRDYAAPRDSDYILRRLYGDYEQLPPPEQRLLRHKPEQIDFGD